MNVQSKITFSVEGATKEKGLYITILIHFSHEQIYLIHAKEIKSFM